MSDDIQLDPDTDTVLQVEEEYTITTIPVRVTGVESPVRTQQLPCKSGGTRTREIGAVPQQILSADPHRAYVMLCAFDHDFYVAFSSEAAQDLSTMSRLPKLVPVTLSVVSDVYVRTYSDLSDLSITTARWATGG